MIKPTAVVAIAVLGAPALAQAQPGIGRGSVVVSGGAAWSGGVGVGTAVANELRNPTTGSGPLTLFTVDARVTAAPAAQVRIGVFLSRRVGIEGSAQFSRPTLSLALANDFEQATGTSAAESLTEYLFDGSVVYRVGLGRIAPFVSAGAGQLRQVHDGGAELDTSTEVHAGGGIVYSLGAPSHRLGLRTDVRVSSRSGGAGFAHERRYVPIISAGLQFRF